MKRDSYTNTYTLSGTIPLTDTGAVASAQVILIADAGRGPLRVMVRNISAFGLDVQIAYDKQSLVALPQDGGAYTLPPGAVDEFIVMPEQKLYAATMALNARISVARSPWIPVDPENLT